MNQTSTDKKFRFRNFPVYQDARYFSKHVKEATKKLPLALQDQLWRALDSILLNIAEGSDRGSDKDFARYLNTARTSLNEVVACLDIALDTGHLEKGYETFIDQAVKLANQLTAFRKAIITAPKIKPF